MRRRRGSVLLFLTVLAVRPASAQMERAAWADGAVAENTGAFVERVAVKLPTARGTTPALDLVYASGGRSGFVGVGWTLLGFGYVERSQPSTFEQFTLDGERLVPCASGSLSPSCRSAVDAFGGSAGYFSTYFDDFRRIKQDVAGDRWIVQGRDGASTVYGGTGHVFHQDATSSPAVFRWLIASRTDRNGNQVSFDWQCEPDGTGGDADCYPYQVRYDNVIVEFERESRHDTLSFGKGLTGTGDAALQGRTTQRLRRIWVRVNDGAAYRLLRLYDLLYDDARTWPQGSNPGSATTRSLLRSVTEFGKDANVSGAGNVSGTAYPPVTFSYDGMSPMNISSQIGTGADLEFTCEHIIPPFVGDFDGNGCDDYAEPSGTADLRVFLGACNGNFTATAPIDLPNAVFPSPRRRRFGDFNGDGRTDIALITSYNAADPIRIYLSAVDPGTGAFTGFTYVAGPAYYVTWTNWGPHEEVDVSRLQTADLNGDGLTDFAIVEGCHHPTPTTVCNQAVPIKILLTQNTGSILSWTEVSGPTVVVGPDSTIGDMLMDVRRAKYGDLNGDRKDDILIIKGDNTTMVTAVPSDIHYSRIGIPGAAPPFTSFLGTGPKFQYLRNPYVPPFGSYGGVEDDTRVRFADFNADGKADVIWFRGGDSDAGPSKIYLSAGSGGRFGNEILGPTQYWFGAYTPFTPAMVPLADFNGDGRADIGKQSGGLIVYLSLGKDANHVTFDTSIPGPAGVYMDCNQVGDFDGDGRPDIGSNTSGSQARVYRASGSTPDYLIGVDNGMGAVTTVAYTPSSRWVNQGRPPTVQTVTSVRTTSHGALIADESYAYGGGLFDSTTQRFLGFGTATVRHPGLEASGEPFGHRKATFLQDARAQAGILQKTEILQGTPAAPVRLLTSAASTLWTGSLKASCATEAPFFTVSGAETVTSFDPAAVDCETDWPVGTDSSCAARTRTEHVYDLTAGAACTGSSLVQTTTGYGNEIRTKLFGDWDHNDGQEHTLEIVFPTTANVTDYVVDKKVASRVLIGVTGGTTVSREEHYFYDNRSPGNGSTGYDAAVSKGNRTTTARLHRRSGDATFTPYYVLEKATYDAVGNLLTEVDEMNRTTTYEYDTTFNKYPTAIVNNAGHRRSLLNYDIPCGRALKDVEPNGNVGANTYLDCGGSCTNLAPGKTVTASGLWDPLGNPAEKVNDGNTGADPTCEHANGYCAIASDAGGGQAVGNYLQIDLGAVMSVKSVTVYGRRDFALTQGQNLYLKTSTDGTSWTSTYMADTTSPAGFTVTTARLARYVRVETSTIVYLSLYEIVVTGSPGSANDTYATIFQLDNLCRDTRVSWPGGDFEAFTYSFHATDPASQWVRIETPGPNGTNLWTKRGFDGAGRPRETRQAGPAAGMDIVRSVTYDLAGRLRTESQPRYATDPEKSDTSHYDAAGRLASLVHPGNSSIRHTYSVSAGSVTETVVDEENHQTVEVRNGFGAVIQYSQGSSGPNIYFNFLDSRILMDPNGNRTTLYFDSLERPFREAHPDRGVWDYEYWDDGQLRRVRDNQSPREVTEFTYDALGRKQTKTTRVGQTGQRVVTWTYDQARPGYSNRGRLTGMQDSAGTATYDHDVAGRPVKEVRTVGTDTYTFQNGYDAGGRLLWRSFPDGTSFGSAGNPIRYDAAGRTSLVPSLIEWVAYTAEGTLRAWGNSNGTITNRTVDPDRGWITSVRTSLPERQQCSTLTLPRNRCVVDWCGDQTYCGPGTFQCCQTIPESIFQDLGYGRDLEGRITAVTSPFDGEGWTYGYDSGHRLLSANRAPGAPQNRTYTYDGTGNMLTNSAVPGTYEYQWADPSTPTIFLPHAVSRIGTRNYTYDRNGNMLTAPSRTFVWNGDGLPEWINGTQVLYDGDNRRLRTVAPTATRTYPSDDYEVAGSTTIKYLNVEGTILAKMMGAQRYWVHTDAVGTLQAITDVNGALTWRQTYEPFGDEKVSSMHYFESRGFTALREDDNGVVDVGARCYDPEIGRFLSPDPLTPGPDTVLSNPYAYASNDPVNALDPSGAEPCHWEGNTIVCPEEQVHGDPWQGNNWSPANGGMPFPHTSFEDLEGRYPTYTWGLWANNWGVHGLVALSFNRAAGQHGIKIVATKGLPILLQQKAHGQIKPVGFRWGSGRVISFETTGGPHVNTEMLSQQHIHPLGPRSAWLVNAAKVNNVRIATAGLFAAGVTLEVAAIAAADPKDRGPMATRAAASLTGSLALGAVGGAFGGPFGAFAGSTAGGYLGTVAADWAMQQNWTVLPSGTTMFTPIWLGPKSP